MRVAELRKEPGRLFLDTTIDRSVNFRSTSVLLPITRISTAEAAEAAEAGEESNKGRSSRAFSIAPVSGSRNWLPALVAAGREEANLRYLAEGSTGGGRRTDAQASDVFFAVDLECVLHKYRRWCQCFPRIKPFYAVKCNPNRVVVSALAMTAGCGFDCASPAEIDLVLGCGVHPSRIIYANPCKEAADLQYALSAGISTVTFDSEEELLKIRRLLNARAKPSASKQQQHANVQVVLRLRVPDAHSDCPLGEKFGAMEEVCSDLIISTIDLGLDLVGVSFHCGSGCQDAQAYPAALEVAKRVFDLAAGHGIWMSLLDIGGGFPGWDGSEYVYSEECQGDDGDGIRSSSPLSLEEIAEATRPVLDELFPPDDGVQVIAEPGRYFVEASHVLFARIYAKRRIVLRADGEGGVVETATAHFINEGVDGCFKDTVIFGVCFEPCLIRAAPAIGRNTDGKRTSEDSKLEEEDTLVMGPSGSTADIVARKRFPKSLGPGDWLYFSRMGAYTASVASAASSAALEASYFYVASAPANHNHC